MKNSGQIVQTCEQSLMFVTTGETSHCSDMALSLGVLEIPLSEAVLLTGSPSQERGVCLGKGLSTIQGHLCLFSLLLLLVADKGPMSE